MGVLYEIFKSGSDLGMLSWIKKQQIFNSRSLSNQGDSSVKRQIKTKNLIRESILFRIFQFIPDIPVFGIPVYSGIFRTGMFTPPCPRALGPGRVLISSPWLNFRGGHVCISGPKKKKRAKAQRPPRKHFWPLEEGGVNFFFNF